VSGDYSLVRARRSLLHFGLGKFASALAGAALLVLTLRLVAPATYGAYVALITVLEMFYLVSGFGLSYFVQRFVPEMRVRGSTRQFNHMLLGLVTARACLALVFAVPMWLASPVWAHWLDLPLTPALAGWFAICLVFGSVTRYFAEVMQALLLQGHAQLQTLLANLIRLAALAWAGMHSETIVLQWLLSLELMVGITTTLSGCVILWNYVRRRPRPSLMVDAADHSMPGAWRHCLRLFLADLLSQTYGMNAVKLLVTAIVGVQGTAVLGYADSVTNLLRAYSPAFLLGGWVRPLLVARYVAHRSVVTLRPLTRLVIGLSLLGLIPFALVFHFFGPELTQWLGKGRYGDGAALLAPLVLVVCLQAVHTVLGMVCATVERPSFVLMAALVCQLSVPVALILTLAFGVAGTVAALIVTELLWVGTVFGLLKHRLGGSGFVDLGGLTRAVLVGLVLGVVLEISRDLISNTGNLYWVVASGFTLVAYWGLAWTFRVIGPDESRLISLFLQGRPTQAAAQ
jgi:O-antigen/teichoic acid export membrane protein